MRKTLLLGLLVLPAMDSAAQSMPDAVASPAPETLGIAQEQTEGVFLPQPAKAPDPWGLARLSGTLVYVSTRNEREVLARFVRFTDSELVITIGGVRRAMRVSDVRGISLQGDSLKNGALLGLAIGPFIGLFNPCDLCNSIARRMIDGAALGAGTGVLVDHMHRGRTTVFPP